MKVGNCKNESGEKFLTEVASVPSPVDFDQMTETGFFFIEKGSELTNYPGDNPQTYGTLQVLSAGDNLTQMFLVCGSAGTSVWERNRYRLDSGSLLFTGWRKLMLATAITENFGSSGYFKLPGGTMVQGGSVSDIAADGTTRLTYPVAFKSTVYTVVANVASGTVSAGGATVNTGAHDKTGFSFILKNHPGGGTVRLYWLAIGY